MLQHFSKTRSIQGERKRSRHTDALQSIGTTFGCTLGQILAHVARPHEPHARLLRCIRHELMNIAQHHMQMSGEDANVLAYGLASCSVLRSERQNLRGTSLRIDTRYGNASAAVGACAAIFVTHAVLARFEPSAAQHFLKADILRLTLRSAEERLSQWSTRHSSLDVDEHALNAERRALRRAHTALDEVVRHTKLQIKTVSDSFHEQLAVAIMAAYPSKKVEPHNQNEMEILTRARDGALFSQRHTELSCNINSSNSSQQLLCTHTLIVPLSGLPQLPIHSTATGCTITSDTSSVSWITSTSTSASMSDTCSEFEIVEKYRT